MSSKDIKVIFMTVWFDSSKWTLSEHCYSFNYQRVQRENVRMTQFFQPER